MRGHNVCEWLKVGETEVCRKSCCQKYCKVHLARIRRGSKIQCAVGLAERGFRVRYIFVKLVVEIKFATDI